MSAAASTPLSIAPLLLSPEKRSREESHGARRRLRRKPGRASRSRQPGAAPWAANREVLPVFRVRGGEGECAFGERSSHSGNKPRPG